MITAFEARMASRDVENPVLADFEASIRRSMAKGHRRAMLCYAGNCEDAEASAIKDLEENGFDVSCASETVCGVRMSAYYAEW